MNCDMAWLVVNEVGQIDTERPKQVSVWNVEEWAKTLKSGRKVFECGLQATRETENIMDKCDDDFCLRISRCFSEFHWWLNDLWASVATAASVAEVQCTNGQAKELIWSKCMWSSYNFIIIVLSWKVEEGDELDAYNIISTRQTELLR